MAINTTTRQGRSILLYPFVSLGKQSLGDLPFMQRSLDILSQHPIAPQRHHEPPQNRQCIVQSQRGKPSK
jgi:hypothetical protein